MLLYHCPPVLIFQELFSINWLFVLCQTMQIYYTPAVFGCYWGKKCLQPSLFCSTSPIEGWYDVLIKKLTGAMHNLLSSLTCWPLGGQLGVGQCLLSQIVRERGRGRRRVNWRRFGWKDADVLLMFAQFLITGLCAYIELVTVSALED